MQEAKATLHSHIEASIAEARNVLDNALVAKGTNALWIGLSRAAATGFKNYFRTLPEKQGVCLPEWATYKNIGRVNIVNLSVFLRVIMMVIYRLLCPLTIHDPLAPFCLHLKGWATSNAYLIKSNETMHQPILWVKKHPPCGSELYMTCHVTGCQMTLANSFALIPLLMLTAMLVMPLFANCISILQVT